MRDDSERILQTLTPALFARTVTKGTREEFRIPDHVAVLDDAIVRAVNSPEGGRLLVSMPPQHGKSNLCSKYTPAWFLGNFPDRNVLLGSYEANFAKSWGRKSRAILDQYGERYFGVELADFPAAANEWATMQGGGMQTAGRNGAFTGKSANLLILDDPFKNWQEADSKLIRDKVFEFYRAAAYTRLAPGATIIIIHTRWHQDDLIGRLLDDNTENWEYIRFQAISDDSKALWPARYSLDELRAKEKTLGSYLWNALYQQSPIPPGGKIFKREWLSKTVESFPAEAYSACRFWDKAGAEPDSDGDWSAGVLMVKHEGLYYVAHVEHGQWSPMERNRIIRSTADNDRSKQIADMQLWIEQEPGNGGKESAQISVQELAEFGPQIDKPFENKVVRARPFAAQCEAGNVRIVRGSWNAKFIDELVNFDKAPHDDMVDAASGAFNKLEQFGRKPGGKVRSVMPALGRR